MCFFRNSYICAYAECVAEVNNLKNFVISDDISKLLKSPGICCEESIPPAYVAWQAGTATL